MSMLKRHHSGGHSIENTILYPELILGRNLLALDTGNVESRITDEAWLLFTTSGPSIKLCAWEEEDYGGHVL